MLSKKKTCLQCHLSFISRNHEEFCCQGCEDSDAQDLIKEKAL